MILLALTRKQLLSVLLIVGAGLAALLIDHLIVTEKERIEGIIRELRLAAEQADADMMVEGFSGNFDAEGISRGDLRLMAQRFFEVHGPVQFRRFEARINRTGRTALAEIHASVDTENHPAARLRGRSVWQLEFQKESDGAWRIADLTPLYIGGQEVESLGELRRWRRF